MDEQERIDSYCSAQDPTYSHRVYVSGKDSAVIFFASFETDCTASRDAEIYTAPSHVSLGLHPRLSFVCFCRGLQLVRRARDR